MIKDYPKQMVVDFDDWGKHQPAHEMLDKIKALNPNIKLNLFTIPLYAQDAWIKDMRARYPWISICGHGFTHAYNTECKDWTGGQTRKYLSMMEAAGFDKVFKAPGWQLSDVVRNAILDSGWILIDRYFNYPPRHQPNDLKDAMSPNSKILLADEGNAEFPRGKWFFHGHITDVCGNGMNELFNAGELEFPHDTEFLFIKDLFQ